MKKIPLTQGMFALVDDEDYDLLSQYTWYAGKQRRNWYAMRKSRKLDGTRFIVFMHNAIMGAKGIDHKNHDGLDNQRSNLRIANQRQNGANRRPNKEGSSAYKGVFWHKHNKKWGVKIGFNGRRIYLGYYIDEVEAAKVYDAKARELFGEFALPNFCTELMERER